LVKPIHQQGTFVVERRIYRSANRFDPPLAKPIAIKRLEIRILSRIPARSGYRAVGLSEVELQLIE